MVRTLLQTIIMTHTYNIQGMTCGSCVAKVKSELLKVGDITEAQVQLAAPQATITMAKHIPVSQIQAAVAKAGNYVVAENGQMHQVAGAEAQRTWLQTYKPILILFGYITAAAFLFAPGSGEAYWMNWMRIFMSGFFLSFSFFKMLDLKGFASSYAGYDILARRIPAWGYIYAFIELGLGFAYALNFNPFITNLTTFVVLSISLIGVLQSVMGGKKIQCACLGTVFNLPMSTVTIIEDAAMILMSGAMLAMLM